jgi:putative oxidoreductase
MNGISRALQKFAPMVPVFVRIVIGGMMLAHGWQKLVGGPAGFAGFLEQLGLPVPILLAWSVTLLELVGGLLLIVGLLTRVVAVLMILELIGAILLVTGANGLIGSEGVGYERDLAYIAGLVTIALLGPGRPSVDHAVGIEAYETPVPARTNS